MQRASHTLTEINRTLVRTFAYMSALAVLIAATAGFFQLPSGSAVFDPFPQAKWVSVDRPHPAFELLMPELAGNPSDYAILHRVTGSARKDVLTWGDPSSRGPYVMIEVYRPGTASDRFIDAPSEIAARIVSFSVTDDVKAADEIDTKFGAVPLVDFAIAQRGHEHRCLGFARAFDAPAMQIAGWYCSAGKEVVDRATLVCVLDRLTIISAGGDQDLAELFAHAEVKRTFCGQRSPILAATPEHEARVTTSSKSRLRGRLPQ